MLEVSTRPVNASCVLVCCKMRHPPTKDPPRGGSRVPVVARCALLKARNNQMPYALLQAHTSWLSTALSHDNAFRQHRVALAGMATVVDQGPVTDILLTSAFGWR